MKYKRTILFAGIAALALVVGNGLASAQDSSKGGIRPRCSAACHATNGSRRDERPIEPGGAH